MMRKLAKYSVLCLGVVFLVAPFAVAGRPLETEDTGIVAPRAWEVEGGVAYGSGNGEKAWGCEVCIAYGVVENFDLHLGQSYVIDSEDNGNHYQGLEDIALMAKWRFVGSDESDVAAILALTGTFPTGNRGEGLSSEEIDGSALVGVSFALPKEITLYVNGGYDALQSADDVYFLSAAVEVPVTAKVTLVAEFAHNGSADGNDDDKSSRALVGASCAVNENLAIDCGVGAGLDNRTPDVTATVGATYAF